MRFLTTPPLRGRVRAPFLLLVAMTACGTLGMHVIIPALPATARALGMSIGTAQLTITLYLIGLAIGQLLYGPVSDRFGRRPVLLVGLSLFTGCQYRDRAGAERHGPDRCAHPAIDWWLCRAGARAGSGARRRHGGQGGRPTRAADAGDGDGAGHRTGDRRVPHGLYRLAGELRAARAVRRGDAGGLRVADARDAVRSVAARAGRW